MFDDARFVDVRYFDFKFYAFVHVGYFGRTLLL